MSINIEEAYTSKYLHYIKLVQKFETKAIPVHLCFAPIGTNILLIANEIFINSKLGYSTQLVPGSYKFDESKINEFNKVHSTHHTLAPWVLQRYDDHYCNPRPWSIWFEDLNDSEVLCDDYDAERLALEFELSRLRPDLATPALLELGACVGYVTRFNKKSLEFLEGKDSIGDTKCAAVHIRRGDACNEDLSVKDPNRRHFPISRYIEEIEKHITQGFNHVYVMTESQREIESLKEFFGTRCVIRSQDIDRSRFASVGERGDDKASFVEYRCLDDPALTKFLQESALVDIYNASKCHALIGTLTSQFSALNYLNMIGSRQARVPLTDLSSKGFENLLFYPSFREKGIPKLLVIRERDVGFFSLLLQIVNTLLCIDEHRLPLLPYVDLGDKQKYFKGSNTWNDLFEDLIPVSRDYIEKSLRAVDRHHTESAKQMKNWDKHGVVHQLRENLLWTGSYYPNLGPRSQEAHIPHFWIPSRCERRNASRIIGKFIKPQAAVVAEVDSFVKEHFQEDYTLGVQFRGTDARMDGRRVIPAKEEFTTAVREHLRRLGRRANIFVASDEQAFIDAMQEEFVNVSWVKTTRHEAEDETVRVAGPSGWGMPSFLDKDVGNALKGAILDFLLLCKCDYLIHNFGSISNAVLLTDPDMDHCLIGEEYKSIVPRPTDDHRVDAEDGVYVLQDARNSENIIGLNADAYRVYELCDGSRNVNRMTRLLATERNQERKAVNSSVRSILRTLQKQGFVDYI